MRKALLSFAVFALTLPLAFGLVACGNGNGGSGDGGVHNPPHALVGTWAMTESSTHVTLTYNFRADKTFTLTHAGPTNTISDSGTWSEYASIITLSDLSSDAPDRSMTFMLTDDMLHITSLNVGGTERVVDQMFHRVTA